MKRTKQSTRMIEMIQHHLNEAQEVWVRGHRRGKTYVKGYWRKAKGGKA